MSTSWLVQRNPFDDAEIMLEQVDELDLTKVKATELLKAHDGDAIRAAKAFISPPTKA